MDLLGFTAAAVWVGGGCALLRVCGAGILQTYVAIFGDILTTGFRLIL